MKIDRIVGQKNKTLSEILDYRKEIYDRHYDYRIIIGDEDDANSITDYIVELLKRDEDFVSTRCKEANYGFYEILRKGLADDYGLFVPKNIPYLYESQWRRLIDKSYNERLYTLI